MRETFYEPTDDDLGAYSKHCQKETTMSKFKWTVEIEVDEVWVADGFDLDNDRMNDIMLEHLSYATSSEVKCKVVKSPSVASVRKAQGYDDTEDTGTSCVPVGGL